MTCSPTEWTGLKAAIGSCGISAISAPRIARSSALFGESRVKSMAGDSAVVLGGADGGKVGLVAAFADAAVERGLSAADVVREAAALVGGGGGGRPNIAQAGGRDASRLDDALAAAREAIERKLAGGE